MLRPRTADPGKEDRGHDWRLCVPQVRIDGSQVLCIVARYSSEKRLTSQGLGMPAALGGRYLVGREVGVAELLELLAELL